MSDVNLNRRYVVLTEGRVAFNNHIVLPGAARVLDNYSILPVTMGYEHESIIGSAHGFARAGVIDGIAKITFNIRLISGSGLTHDDLVSLKPGVFMTNVFAYQQPGENEKWITDGLIQEISFYDPRPPAVKFENGD
jgi:hypothetical protein